MKKFLVVLLWFFSLIIAIIYTYENPEKFNAIKDLLKKNTSPQVELEKGSTEIVIANSFNVEFSKVLSLDSKTAFIIHSEKTSDFSESNLEIFTQNGYLLKNSISQKLNLPKSFTTRKNGGIKTIFTYKDSQFALISSLKQKCFYASIILLDNLKEIFKTNCLPDDTIDFNGLGSSSIHYDKKIILSIGAPEQIKHKIAELAQNDYSYFGKIIEIEKSDLNKIISDEENNLVPRIFSKGHRNPQGLTKIDDSIFAVEHGPRGGDELNRIIKNKNYGWPIVSYGTKYLYDKNNKSYETNHENNEFEEPLFALIPSVGISAVNNCPLKLNKYYKKPCLLALSLHGNEIRKGRSIIIYLLSEKMDKVHSIEKIFLRDDLKLRHFVTNSKNEIYEDTNGDIYVSADRKGIYKLSFAEFRN